MQYTSHFLQLPTFSYNVDNKSYLTLPPILLRDESPIIPMAKPALSVVKEELPQPCQKTIKKAAKKPKLAKGEKRECAWCHKTDTPEWRSGPGDKRLCNACGLQYRKITQLTGIKKKQINTKPSALAISSLLN